MSKASVSVTVNTKPLARAVELTHQALGDALEALGEEIVTDAKENCPRSDIDRAGYLHLQDSLEAEVTDDLQIAVHDGVPHGQWVELGTTRMPARPFLTPAVERGRERLPDLVGKALERAFSEASRG